MPLCTNAPSPNGVTFNFYPRLNINERNLSTTSKLTFHEKATGRIGPLVFIPKQSATQGTVKAVRAITLLNNPAKLFGKSINVRLNIFLHIFGRLSNRQYGFVKQRSTEDAVCDLIEFIRKNRSRGKFTVIFSFDIAAAFDSADLEAIVRALRRNGTPKHLRNIISSFLNNRNIRTTNPLIQSRPLSQDAAQGSILYQAFGTCF